MAGVSQSCGCLRNEVARSPKKNNPYKGTKTHNTWAGMKQRCLNKNRKQYADYGGRGITVCKRWFVYENFLADMGERPPGTTLERIGNDGDYEPMNCKWASYVEQQSNTRKSLPLWEGKSIADWAREKGVPYMKLYTKFKKTGRPF